MPALRWSGAATTKTRATSQARSTRRLLTSEKESPPGTPANPIEERQVGYWMRRPTELAPTIERLLANPAELARLQADTRSLAQPHAAREAMLKGWQARR
jgi:hypothetical protein